jgi:hypothetical protein
LQGGGFPQDVPDAMSLCYRHRAHAARSGSDERIFGEK